jgi:hypothetical protein
MADFTPHPLSFAMALRFWRGILLVRRPCEQGSRELAISYSKSGYVALVAGTDADLQRDLRTLQEPAQYRVQRNQAAGSLGARFPGCRTGGRRPNPAIGTAEMPTL